MYSDGICGSEGREGRVVVFTTIFGSKGWRLVCGLLGWSLEKNVRGNRVLQNLFGGRWCKALGIADGHQKKHVTWDPHFS